MMFTWTTRWCAHIILYSKNFSNLVLLTKKNYKNLTIYGKNYYILTVVETVKVNILLRCH